MMSSIKTKLILICTAVVLIVMIVSGSFMLQRVKSTETQKSLEQLKDHARAINELIVQVYDSSQYIDAFETWNTVAQGPYDIEGCILDNLGEPIAPIEFRPLNVNDSAVVAALAGKEAYAMGKRAADLNGMEQEWLSFAMPANKPEAHYVVYTRMSTKPMNDNLSQLTVTIVFMVFIALALTGSLWFLFANTLTGPIIALTRRAKEMAAGDLDNKIHVHSNDEIGQLTESFNQMAAELSHNVSNMASEKSKIEAVLHNMTDGVLAYDAAGKIIHANSACIEMLNTFDIQEMHMDEMLLRLQLKPDEVHKLKSEEVKESTLPIGDRYAHATITPYNNKDGQVDGFVIVLQDVTKHTKLDNMRKEFVANVSHELRTPLTSVQTYTETLLNGAIDEPETARQFLKVVDEETQRMSLLVMDLLELSRLDNKQLAIELEAVDLAGLLKLSIKQNQVLADKKNQCIHFDAPGKPYFIEADAGRINQVLTNILSNSIKYSPEGTDIEVAMEETDRFYRVFIKDHGIGIPKNDVRLIFERFYRVDKARSRTMGGTGLGLAIAKEIMEEHGGRIIVSSELGKGTTMVLRFRKIIEQ